MDVKVRSVCTSVLWGRIREVSEAFGQTNPLIRTGNIRLQSQVRTVAQRLVRYLTPGDVTNTQERVREEKYMLRQRFPWRQKQFMGMAHERC